MTNTDSRPRLARAGLCRSIALIAALVPAIALAAGNVTVTDDGRCVIEGDTGANAIRIAAAGSPSAMVVSGLNGTTVNGGTQVTIPAVHNLIINLGRGDDSVVAEGYAPAHTLEVELGPGDDALSWTGGSVEGNLRVDGGEGRDDLAIRSLLVGDEDKARGNLRILGDGDADEITVESVGVFGTLRLESGQGDDTVFVNVFSAHKNVTVDTAGGTDEVDLQDALFFANSHVVLGSEDDVVRFRALDSRGSLTLDGVSGVDTYVNAGANVFKRLTVKNIEHQIVGP